MKRQLFEHLDFLFTPFVSTHSRVAWRPAADVYLCDSGWLIKFDLAGVQEEDIKIRMTGTNVTVSGTRRDLRIYKQQEAHSMEIAYSQFERSVELPEETVPVGFRTEYSDGMLLVHVAVEYETTS